MFNQATIIGRLTRDAEVGALPNERKTPRVRFTVAVDRDYEVDGETPTDFWPVEIIGEYATKMAPFLTKGRLLLCAGAAHINSDRAEDGHYRVFPFISARTVRFLDRRPREADTEEAAGAAE